MQQVKFGRIIGQPKKQFASAGASCRRESGRRRGRQYEWHRFSSEFQLSQSLVTEFQATLSISRHCTPPLLFRTHQKCAFRFPSRRNGYCHFNNSICRWRVPQKRETEDTDSFVQQLLMFYFGPMPLLATVLLLLLVSVLAALQAPPPPVGLDAGRASQWEYCKAGRGFCRHEPVSRLGFVSPRARGLCVMSSETAVCATRKKNEGPLVFTNVTRVALLGRSGQPPLTITYTNDGATVTEWLQRHVGPDVHSVGFDTETVPSVRRKSAQSAGPATLQLATSEGACLVVHLAHVPRQNCFVSPASGEIKDAPDASSLLPRLRGMEQLAQVLSNTRVMKVGVGIDQDAIEMWRDHRLRLSGRFDLGGIGATSKNRLQGLQKLSEMVVPGLQLAKSKRISMSDWSVVPLTSQQIEYAAADAYAGAVIFSTLLTPPLDRHSPHAESLPTLELERLRTAVLKKEREVSDMDDRASRRRAAKLEIQARETVLDLAQDRDSQTSAVKPAIKKLLQDLLKSPKDFNTRLEAARTVFCETRPKTPLSTEDFEKLDMMKHVSKTTPK